MTDNISTASPPSANLCISQMIKLHHPVNLAGRLKPLKMEKKTDSVWFPMNASPVNVG